MSLVVECFNQCEFSQTMILLIASSIQRFVAPVVAGCIITFSTPDHALASTNNDAIKDGKVFFTVACESETVTVKARNISVFKILDRLAKECSLGIYTPNPAGLKRAVTLDESGDVDEIVSSLLRGVDHLVVYNEGKTNRGYHSNLRGIGSQTSDTSFSHLVDKNGASLEVSVRAHFDQLRSLTKEEILDNPDIFSGVWASELFKSVSAETKKNNPNWRDDFNRMVKIHTEAAHAYWSSTHFEENASKSDQIRVQIARLKKNIASGSSDRAYENAIKIKSPEFVTHDREILARYQAQLAELTKLDY